MLLPLARLVRSILANNGALRHVMPSFSSQAEGVSPSA